MDEHPPGPVPRNGLISEQLHREPGWTTWFDIGTRAFFARLTNHRCLILITLTDILGNAAPTAPLHNGAIKFLLSALPSVQTGLNALLKNITRMEQGHSRCFCRETG